MNKKIKSIIVAMLMIAGTGLILTPVQADPSPGENELMFVGAGDTTGAAIDVTVGDTDIRYDFYAKLLNITDSIAASGNQSAFVEWAPASALNFTGASVGDIFSSQEVLVLPNDPEDYDNDVGWMRNCSWSTANEANSTNGRAFNFTWDALEVGTVDIWHNNSQTVYEGVYCPTTLRIDGQIRIHPQDPGSFNEAGSGSNWYNMSWTSATGIDNYVIIRSKTATPTGPPDGTGELYNGSALFYNDTGLDIEDDYYYSIWGYNTTEGYYSLNYDSLTKESDDTLPTGFTVTTTDKSTIDLSWTTVDEGTATLRPNDNGTSADWTILGGDTYNWQAVDDVTPDGATTRVRSFTNGEYDSYGFSDYSNSKPIKEVKLVANVTVDSAETCILSLYNGVTRINSTSKSPSTSGYAEISHTWSQNPFTTSDWTSTALNALEGGIEYTGTGTGIMSVTQMYFEVTYYDTPTYVIERSESAGPWAQGTGTEVYNGTGLSYTDSGLWPDTDYYYQLWTYNDTDGPLYSTDYLTGDDHTTDNINLTISNPDPADAAGGTQYEVDKDYTEVSIDIADGNGDTFNYTIEGQYVTNEDVTGASNGTFTASLITPLPYSTVITWYVNATDGYDPQEAVYTFTVRDEFVPATPDSFTATAWNRTQINLTWNLVTLGEYVVIERNTAETWSMGAGTEIYNGTGTEYNDDGTVGLGGRLDDGVTYYYQAWSYNVTDNVYSTTYAEDNDTTTGNQAPNQPTSVVIHDDDYVSVYDAYLNVTVSDPDADTLEVTFYWANHTAIYFNSAVTSGDYVNISLPDYINPDWLDHDTKYEWYVVVNDTFDEYNTSAQVGDYWFNTTHDTDLNEDQSVDVTDASNLVTNWGEENASNGGWIAADINNDGDVAVVDASALVTDWGWTKS